MASRKRKTTSVGTDPKPAEESNTSKKKKQENKLDSQKEEKQDITPAASVTTDATKPTTNTTTEKNKTEQVQDTKTTTKTTTRTKTPKKAAKKSGAKKASKYGTAFLVTTKGKYEIIDNCNGDMAAMQKAVGGNYTLVAIERAHFKTYPFDMYMDDEAGFKEDVGMNDLGAFVIEACYGSIQSFFPIGVRGPLLIVARETAKSSSQSLKETEIKALTEFCDSIIKNDDEDGDEDEDASLAKATLQLRSTFKKTAASV